MQNVLIPHCIEGGALPKGPVLELKGLTMGTSWSVKLAGGVVHGGAALQRQTELQQQLDEVVAQMSHWESGSDLSRFNAAQAGSWCIIPEDFHHVLSYGLEVASESEGAYDPAAGALVDLWGFGAQGRHDEDGFCVPANEVQARVRSLPGWRQIELATDASGRHQVRQPGGVRLDFSAIAKGFAVDKLARYLQQQGVQHYLVEVGGELRGAGVKPDGQPWWVSLEAPPAGGTGTPAWQPRGAGQDGVTLARTGASLPASRISDTIVALHGLSIATSGDYRRNFVSNGLAYSHTLDPRTGQPVRNGVAAVTVVHESCMAADALSTALTVLGAQKGLCFAEARNIAARFLVRQGQGYAETTTSRYRDMLQ
ncbi:MAG: FAD:protein FMN transferase [Janthinobacterium lividum]